MVVKQQGQKFQQYLCAMIASTGALVIGNILAWSAPSFRFLKSDNYSAPFMLDNEREEEIIAAIMPFGALLGSLPAGFLADLFGRKWTLTVFTVPWIVSWVLTIFVTKVSMLYVARFVAGLVSGIFCGILPLYVNEIAEDSIRGALGTFFQLFVTLGQLLVEILGIFDSYRILCYGCTLFCLALFVGLPFIPESPLYLAKKKRSMEAEKVLRRLRGPHYDVSLEMKDINEQLETLAKLKTSFSTVFTKARFRSLLICFGLMVFQQLSGVNSVIFFSTMIFEEAKASSPVICTIIFGLSQSLATIASGFLIERTGRKMLLLISIESMGCSLLAMGYYFWMLDHKISTANLSWLPLGSTVFFIVGFSLGIGPIPWLISVELLDPEIKSFGTTLTAATNLACVTLVTFSFEPLVDLISAAYTFWLFASVCLLGTLFILAMVPETKGKSVQEMQLIMAGKKLNIVDDELP